MKLKFIPWLLVLLLGIGLAILYGSNQRQAEELAQLRQANQDLQPHAAAVETAPTQTQAQAAVDEVARLRAENQDLLRLRNDVRRLREENQQLKGQAQSAQAQVQSAQAQAEQFRNSAAQANAQAQNLEAASRLQSQANAAAACINNLRQIDGAKQQWALEHSKSADSPVTAPDILPYLRNNLPSCPAGGVYTLNIVGVLPTCSVPGHTLPKAQ